LKSEGRKDPKSKVPSGVSNVVSRKIADEYFGSGKTSSFSSFEKFKEKNLEEEGRKEKKKPSPALGKVMDEKGMNLFYFSIPTFVF